MQTARRLLMPPDEARVNKIPFPPSCQISKTSHYESRTSWTLMVLDPGQYFLLKNSCTKLLMHDLLTPLSDCTLHIISIFKPSNDNSPKKPPSKNLSVH